MKLKSGVVVLPVKLQFRASDSFWQRVLVFKAVHNFKNLNDAVTELIRKGLESSK